MAGDILDRPKLNYQGVQFFKPFYYPTKNISNWSGYHRLLLSFKNSSEGIPEFWALCRLLLNFLMELLSYTNRNLADYSKGVHELLLPTAPTAFVDPESFIPIAMIPALNRNYDLEGEYYLLDGESFPTPNRSICAEEYDHLIDSHVSRNHNIPTAIKSEYEYMVNELGHTDHVHYQHVPEAVIAKYLPLQDMSYPNSGMHSPLLKKRINLAVQYTQDSPFHHSDCQGQDGSVSEVALQTPQYLPPLLRPGSNIHTDMNPLFHYKSLGGLQQYPDMTTMVNSNSNIVAPMVETTFIDHKVCNICGRRITRDMTRHMRTHQVNKRFVCDFPKGSCRHRSGQFNRRYDYKKHLLNNHFVFDDQNVKKVHNLKGKLDGWGTCHCGRRFLSSDWLDNHILTEDQACKCPLMYE